jgi:cell division protein ZapA (FtsZ GTPase activity inhibitor)
MSKKSVSVRICGQEYRILSDADEAGLQEVAGYVDDAMRTIRERTGTVDSLDVAVLTALNFAREIIAFKELVIERESTRIVDADRLHALIELAESAGSAPTPQESSAPRSGAVAAGT